MYDVAGLCQKWSAPDGIQKYSFTPITHNAGDHPLLKGFPPPGDEESSLVIVPAHIYDAWLTCRGTQLAQTFLPPFSAG